MMLTVASIALYGVIVIRLMQTGIFSMFELILAAMPLYPLRMYAKSKQYLVTVYFSWLSIATISRLYYFSALLDKYGSAQLNYEFRLKVAESSGAVYFSVMLVYLIVLWFISTRVIKGEFKKMGKLPVFSEQSYRTIGRMRSLMSTAVAVYILQVVFGVFVFTMQDYGWNCCAFVLVAVAIQSAHTLYVRGSFKEWEKEKIASTQEDEEYGM